MKRIFLLLLAIFVTLPLQLQALQREHVCKRMDTEPKYQQQCEDIMQDGVFEEYPLLICDSYPLPKATIPCLKAIKNGKFYYDTARFCELFPTLKQTTKCFTIVRNKVYKASDLEICDSEASNRKILSCMKKRGYTIAPYNGNER